MVKPSKFFIIYFLLAWTYIVFAIISTATGKVCVSYQGFAIDAESNIYLGEHACIEVINEDGALLRTINPFTSRGYRFTIAADNTIRISTGDYIYQTDLFGNLLDKKEINNYTDDLSILVTKRIKTSPDGTVYAMKNKLFRPCIYRLDGAQETVVYKMPVFDYIVRLLGIAYCISFPIVVVLGITKLRKVMKKNGRKH